MGMFALWWLAAPVTFADDLELSEVEVAAQHERLASLGLELMLERQKRLTRVSSALRYRGAALCEGAQRAAPRTAPSECASAVAAGRMYICITTGR